MPGKEGRLFLVQVTHTPDVIALLMGARRLNYHQDGNVVRSIVDGHQHFHHRKEDDPSRLIQTLNACCAEYKLSEDQTRHFSISAPEAGDWVIAFLMGRNDELLGAYFFSIPKKD